jgi:hypothetical protein
LIICANLIWYDEHPEDLSEMVDSLKGFADCLVALDGAFENFPDVESPTSNAEQITALAEASARNGIALLVYQPSEIGKWVGGFKGEEVAKRNAAFRLCAPFAPDWVVILDADMRVHKHLGARDLLEWTDKIVAVTDVDGQRHRHVFRWTPTLRYMRSHYVAVDGDRTLFCPVVRTPITEPLGPLEEPIDLFDVLQFNHVEKKDFWRRARQNVYYQHRDKNLIEALQEPEKASE